MAQLYSDEDFFLEVVEELRRLRHHVLTAFTAGMANQGFSDLDQLAFATSQDRLVVTRNYWDFVRLHRYCQPHGGIVACSTDYNFIAQAQKIHQALLACPVLANQLIRIHKS